ncbi:MAG TPA: tRNA (guanosine(37)-N1)-methyltransferase TrmD [Chloroflexota bacterium]
MRIDILTIFPNMFNGPWAESILRRALDRGLVEINVHDLRQWTHDRHHTVDDTPYGGGPGMIFKPDPIFEAVDQIAAPGSEIVLLTPNGQLLQQSLVRELAAIDQIVLICGHYEGIDDRVGDHLATRLISIGDYVLSGGEIPAMVLTDAIVRLLPGVLGCADSSREEAHSEGLLEYPQYTRPPEYRGHLVPDVVKSGDHQELARWQRREALRRTRNRRPDLLRPEDWEEMRKLGLLDEARSDQ